MKKIFVLLVLSTSAIAATSDLVKEFTKRRSMVETSTHREIYHFLRGFQKAPADIKELELLNKSGKFALRFKNDDVCFGDVQTASMQCYNAIGYKTFFEAGDTD